jgi:hypothetical protein
MKLLHLEPSENRTKKWTVILEDKQKKQHKVSFGAEGYNDFTLFEDRVKAEERKKLYLMRHKDKEDWTKEGILTPGFWSRWVLWNKPTVQESLNDVKKKFKL